VARRYARRVDEVLLTAGAAEAFELVVRLKAWRRPVVIHPQFTEPHAALERAGHQVTPVLLRAEHGFRLDPELIPGDADLVFIGNPTNPTGVLHRADDIERLRRPKRLVVVDEAFMDTVAGERESLAHDRRRGLLVVRSLTEHWSSPGIRAAHVVGNGRAIAGLASREEQRAVAEAGERAHRIAEWRAAMVTRLRERGVEVFDSESSFVLARMGPGTREGLRRRGVAVRRADTFPGLDPSWTRIAVRPPEMCVELYDALDAVRAHAPA